MGKHKRIPNSHEATKKTVHSLIECNADTQYVVWTFDKIDRIGKFAFDLDTIERNGHLKEIIDKYVSFSTLTWAQVKQQTHDYHGKTKHHYLDFKGMSDEARERISSMKLDEYTDTIFSFALQNKLRVIGIREKQIFHIVWYDPEHAFYPTTK